MIFKKRLLCFLLPILVVTGSLFVSATAKAQVLTNAITDIKLWDTANAREVTKVNDVYQMVQGGKYSYNLSFDLSAYDGRLQDGDTFTFTAPPGVTLTDGADFILTDQVTKVQLGRATVKSDGSGQGGVVTVTIQNLADFLAKSPVSAVKGSFFFEFVATNIGDNQTFNYKPDETKTALSHKVTIKPRQAPAPLNTAGENLAKINGVIANLPYDSGILGKKGTYVHPWTLRINAQQKTYTSPIVIKDRVSEDGAPMQFIPEKVVLRSGAYKISLSSISDAKILKQGVDYTITYNDTYTEFTLTIPNPGNSAFMLTYQTTSPADGSLVGNTASMEIDGAAIRANDNRPTPYFHVERSSRITDGGIITADISNSLIIYKVDSVTGARLEGAVFKVTTPSGTEITLPPTDANGRTATTPFSNEEVAKGAFTVQEVTAPNGYVLDPVAFQTTIDGNGTVKTIKNTRDLNAKTTINVTKKWDDANNQDGKRPANVTIDILGNGNKVAELTLTGGASDAEWTGQEKDLPLFDAAGQVITYTISENQVADYQTPVIDQASRTVTNSRTPEVLDYEVTKVWDDSDNQDNKRPASIEVQLYKSVDGAAPTAIAGKTLTLTKDDADDDNTWVKSFTALPRYESGKEIVYSVREVGAPTGYTSVVEGKKITNRYSPELVSHHVDKVWDDDSNRDGIRPTSLEIQLYKSVDGAAPTAVAGKTLTLTNAGGTDTWSGTFQNLPRYEAGKEIIYSAKEVAVPAEYTVAHHTDTPNQKTTITNSYTPLVMDINATKVWDDANNQDGKRPTSIKIHLVKTVAGLETVVASKDITAAENWTAVFADQPVNENGQKITYSVKEDAVAEYTSVIKDFTVTNSYIPKTVDYKVTKKWQDDSNRDAKRPTQITVQLYKSVAGGAEVAVAGKTLALTAANKSDDDDTWEASFTDLPKYEAGQEITYSVKEDDATLAALAAINYTAEVKGQEIINSYTPETITISGRKVWDDFNNIVGKRPTSITVKIKNGPTVIEEIQVTEAGGWEFTSKALPKYEAGQEIVYTVEEVVVSGYTASQNKDADGKYVLTNTYRPVAPPTPTPPQPTPTPQPTPPSSSRLPGSNTKPSGQPNDPNQSQSPDDNTKPSGQLNDPSQSRNDDSGNGQGGQQNGDASSKGQSKAGDSKNLPKTGEGDSAILVLFGATILLLGGALFGKKRMNP